MDDSCQARLCHFCGMNFDSRAEYFKHLSASHQSDTDEFGKVCSICDQEFTSLKLLRRHKRIMHPKEDSKSLEFQCNHCDDVISGFEYLLEHYKENHDGLCLPDYEKCQLFRKNDRPTYIRCKEPGCEVELASCNQLRKHLTQVHDIPMKSNVHRFKNIEEFEKWKVGMEVETKSNYLLTSGTKCNPDYVYRLYDCNRSGKYVCKVGDRKRRLKRQGSCKIQGKCPSQLTVKVYNGGGVEVRHQVTHYGHDLDLSHIRLSKSDRSLISDKIAMGMSTKQIMHELGTQQLQRPDAERLQLLSRKTILNIRKAVGVAGASQEDNMDDFTAAHLKVDTLRSLKTVNVVMYKQHREEEDKYPQLLLSDYALGLATEDQLKFISEFGMRVICLDWGQCLTSYRYYLLTVTIIDDVGQAVPVAWLQTKAHNCLLVVQYFFESLKITYYHKMNRNFPIPCYILGESDPGLAAIWLEVFGGHSKVVNTCGWHVNKMWIKRLNLVKGIKYKAEIYDKIKSILSLSSLQEAETSFTELKNMLVGNKITKRFGSYFFKDLMDCEEQWGRILWDKSGLMYLESFEKLYKYMFVDAKVNCRLDQCVVALLFYQKTLYSDRIARINKIINQDAPQPFKCLHKTSLCIPESKVSKTSAHQYVIESNYPDPSFNVMRCYDGCQESICLVSCTQCHICCHILTCDCPDSITKTMLCKHCHAVATKYPDDFAEENDNVCVVLKGTDLQEYDMVVDTNVRVDADSDLEENVIIENIEGIEEVCNTGCIEVVGYEETMETDINVGEEPIQVDSNEVCDRFRSILIKMSEVTDKETLDKVSEQLDKIEEILSQSQSNKKSNQILVYDANTLQLLTGNDKLQDLGNSTIYVITKNKS